MNEPTRARQLFVELMELPPDQRQEQLEARCAGDTALRAELNRLLAAYDRAGEFLAGPTLSVHAKAGAFRVGAELHSATPSSAPVGNVGRYTLVHPLGEGGFGTVYLAEQLEPVKRQVALKIIKAGMDTRQVIARFQAERQALALMNHPHIAKVFDAGETEIGRPFFVMELVEGTPINQFCDANKL